SPPGGMAARGSRQKASRRSASVRTTSAAVRPSQAPKSISAKAGWISSAMPQPAAKYSANRRQRASGEVTTRSTGPIVATAPAIESKPAAVSSSSVRPRKPSPPVVAPWRSIHTTASVIDPARHGRFVEGGHAVVQRTGETQKRQCRGGAGALAEPQAKVDDRRQAQRTDHAVMARL